MYFSFCFKNFLSCSFIARAFTSKTASLLLALLTSHLLQNWEQQRAGVRAAAGGFVTARAAPPTPPSDFMKGPYMLPNNLKEGDYIEIGQLGSYGLTFRTKFNGFYSDDIFEIDDKPIMSVYQNEQDEEYKSNYLVA